MIYFPIIIKPDECLWLNLSEYDCRAVIHRFMSVVSGKLQPEHIKELHFSKELRERHVAVTKYGTAIATEYLNIQTYLRLCCPQVRRFCGILEVKGSNTKAFNSTTHDLLSCEWNTFHIPKIVINGKEFNGENYEKWEIKEAKRYSVII